MPENPEKEWRRLTDHYAGLYDEQLLELAADLHHLTEVARQALREEMHKRKLPDPAHSPAGSAHPQNVHFAPQEDPADSAMEREYTWKTDLCDCQDLEQAAQLREALRRAGIESWINTVSYDPFSNRGPRIQVPADQLEHAHQIASQPIPDEVVQELRAGTAEFETPQCPQCGGEDPLLLGVEPANSWGCEACGHEWSDPEPAPGPTAS